MRGEEADVNNMAPRRKFDLKFKERVLQFAEEHSGEKAARHFNIDSKRIRYWRKQKDELLRADQGRARLSGGGRKKVNAELETRLSRWIHSMWDQRQPITSKMIESAALELFPSVGGGGKACVSGSAWLQRFLQRNNLSVRHRTQQTHKDPESLSEELVWFVDHVGHMVSCNGISEDDIIVMDETVVWFDAASPSAADRQNCLLTIVLAAKADGTKLNPFVVLKAAAGEVTALQQQTAGAVITTSASGWMDDALTADWLQCVLGRFSSTPRLLVWDSYHCHISGATAAELRCGYNITTAVIPPGGTRYIHPPAVMWSQAFRQNLQETFDRWRVGDTGEVTAAGPDHRLLVDWAVAAWDGLDKVMIRDSFKVCGISVRSDGSEDDLILCFRAGQPLASGRETLGRRRQISGESQRHPVRQEEDEEELFNNELVVFDDDDEGEEEEEEEESDHMTWLCFINHALPSKQMIKEEQQEWSSSLDQEDPELPHIKEEQEELWSSQEGEQFGGLEEAQIKFTPVPVKSEEEELETDDSADWTEVSRL